MTITQQDALTAAAQGRERGLAGGDPSENPHSTSATASKETRVLGIAWRQGHQAGLQVRLADNARQPHLPNDQ